MTKNNDLMENEIKKSTNLRAKLPLWLLRGVAVSTLSITIFIFVTSYTIKVEPNCAQAQCTALPPGLRYLGSCHMGSGYPVGPNPCKCNLGETIMLVEEAGRDASGSASACTVRNQGFITVEGFRNNSNAWKCSFACFN